MSTASQRQGRDSGPSGKGAANSRDGGSSAVDRAVAQAKVGTAKNRGIAGAYADAKTSGASRADATKASQDWASSLSADPQLSGWLSSLAGIKSQPQYNPATGEFEDFYTKELSPMSIALGLSGPLGLAAALIGKATGVQDPLAFSMDLGFAPQAGSTQPSTKTAKRDKSGNDKPVDFGQNPVTQAANATDPNAAPAPQFGDKVAEIINNTQFEFGAMPDFALLSNVFGTDLQQLLADSKKKA